MAHHSQHIIIVCTDCRITGTACHPGLELLARLNDSLSRMGVASGSDFSVEGTVCMAGCRRPCTIAFQASGKATYLLGDIEPDTDIAALVDFATIYAERPDGLTREAERPQSRRQDHCPHPGGCPDFGTSRRAHSMKPAGLGDNP